MKTETKIRIVTFIGVAIVLLRAGFQGGMNFSVIALILGSLLVLHWIIPAKFDRYFGTFEVLFFWIGILLALIVENFLGGIPSWLIWTWLGVSLAISVLYPFPLFKNSSPRGR